VIKVIGRRKIFVGCGSRFCTIDAGLDKQLIKCLQVELNPLFRHDFPRFCVQGNLRPGRCYRVKTGQAYIGTKPSKKRVLKLCESISQKTQREANGRDTEEMIEQLNLMLKGWPTIFGLVRCAKPMKAWIAMFETGCANGWDESTR